MGGSLFLSEKEIQVEVQTSIEGPLSIVSVAPKLAASRIRARVDSLRIEAEIASDSLEVISERISCGDRQKIKKAVGDKILKLQQFPLIRFVSLKWEVNPDFISVTGQLTINGVGKELEILFERTEGQVTSRLSILQSDFKIVPLTAMGGALRCRDNLEITIRILLDGYDPRHTSE